MKTEDLNPNAATKDSSSQEVAPKPQEQTYTEVSKLFVLLIKPSSVVAIIDDNTKLPTGRYRVKFWQDEEVREAGEVQVNRQVMSGTSDVPLQVGVEQMVVASFTVSAQLKEKFGKPGQYQVSDKKISSLTVKALHKKSK